MKLISNNKKDNHISKINRLLRISDEVFIAVAFFKKSGFDLIEKSLTDSLKNGLRITLICGLDFYQTEPEALRAFYALTQQYKNCNLLINNQNNQNTFHPKFYYFKRKDKMTLIVGSANLTKGGFENNFELSASMTYKLDSEVQKDTIRLIDNIKTNCTEYSEIEISNYTRKYQIHKRNEKRSNKKSKLETKVLFQLDREKISKFLKDYKSDKSQIEDLELRTNNYLEAKIVLEKIRTENLSQKQFFENYERLVGKAGVKSLWHSGSIFRGKETVKLFDKEFKVMLNEIVKDLDLSPLLVLKKVEKYYKKGNDEKIDQIGSNIMTEILNTYAPEKYAVLNDNPVTSIRYLGFEEFPKPSQFKPKDYENFNVLLTSIMNGYGFKTLGHVDHFLNYIYWKIKNNDKN